MASFEEHRRWLVKNLVVIMALSIPIVGSIGLFSLAFGDHIMADVSQPISTTQYPFYYDHMSRGEQIIVDCEIQGGSIDILVQYGPIGSSQRSTVKEWSDVSSGTYAYTTTNEGYHSVSIRSSSGVVNADYVIRTSGGDWRTPQYVAFGMGAFLLLFVFLVYNSTRDIKSPAHFKERRIKFLGVFWILIGFLQGMSLIIQGLWWGSIVGFVSILMGFFCFQIGTVGDGLVLYTELGMDDVAERISTVAGNSGISMVETGSKGFPFLWKRSYKIDSMNVNVGLSRAFLKSADTMIWVSESSSPLFRDFVNKLGNVLECSDFEPLK